MTSCVLCQRCVTVTFLTLPGLSSTPEGRCTCKMLYGWNGDFGRKKSVDVSGKLDASTGRVLVRILLVFDFSVLLLSVRINCRFDFCFSIARTP